MSCLHRKTACLLLSALFLAGMLLIFFAYPIGELLSRQYGGIGVYSIDPDEARFRAVSSMVAGGILSLLSGRGLLDLFLCPVRKRTAPPVAEKASGDTAEAS